MTEFVVSDPTPSLPFTPTLYPCNYPLPPLKPLKLLKPFQSPLKDLVKDVRGPPKALSPLRGLQGLKFLTALQLQG